MSGSAAPEDSTGGTLYFPNGNEAFVVVEHSDRDDVDALLERVGLSDEPARPVIVVCGGANRLRAPHLAVAETVLGPAVAQAARVTGAALVDGGTDAGVMAVVGAASDRLGSSKAVLVGVAPRRRVRMPEDEECDRAPLEPHHSHFLLADSDEWGGERKLLFRVAAGIAGPCRVVVVLAGGGPQARQETLEAVRRGWPVVILRGSGGLADELVDEGSVALGQPRLSSRRGLRRLRRLIDKERARRRCTSGSTIRRILREGDLRFFAEREPARLARWLTWELRDEPMLKDAWRTFTGYDRRATALRSTFELFQRAIIGFGVLTTALGLLYDASKAPALRWATVAAPALVAVTVAVASRRAAGKRWVLLRAAAEAVKSEIYQYRTHTGPYRAVETSAGRVLGSNVLAKRLNALDAQLVQTEASSGPMEPEANSVPPDLPGEADDGISTLDAQHYIKLRVEDQLAYYRDKVKCLNRLRGRLQLLSLTIGGAGTIVAAAGAEVWIALTTAVSAGLISYLSTLQVDNTIVQYNQSAAQLASIRRDWLAIEAETAAAFEEVVTRAERALTSELSGWVQQMNTAIEANEASLAAQHAREDASDPTGGVTKP